MEMPDVFPIRKALELSDHDLGRFLLAWNIGEQAEERGIPVNQIPQEIAGAIVHQTLAMKASTARQAALMEVLRKAADGDFEGAGRFIREHLTDRIVQAAALDEAVTGKRRQRENAKKPRPDALQLLIESILSEHPGVTAAGLLVEMRKPEHGDVIDSIDDVDGVIEWRDENNPAGTAPISGLKDRLSRARKKTSSR